jgi:hypothetical protein
MSQSYEFYAEQARKAGEDAAAATLDNVRDRALRSESAWRDLANRARKTESDRAKREAAAQAARELAAAAVEPAE